MGKDIVEKVGDCVFCKSPVYPPRIKYCSEDCMKIVTREGVADARKLATVKRNANREVRYCKMSECENEVSAGRREYCDDCAPKAGGERNRREIGRIIRETTAFHNEYNEKDRKVRTCLSCNKEFLSGGAWNRKCPGCGDGTTRQTNKSDIDE